MNPPRFRSDARVDQMQRINSLASIKDFRRTSSRDAINLFDAESVEVFHYSPSDRVLAVRAADADYGGPVCAARCRTHVRSMCSLRKWVEQLMHGS